MPLHRSLPLLLLIAASVVWLTACQQRSGPAALPVTEQSIGAELAPYLENRTAAIEVRLRKQEFPETGRTDRVRLIATLYPSISAVEERLAGVQAGKIPNTARDFRTLVNKYPHIFRVQNCTTSMSCEFRRLAPGRWILFVAYSVTENPGTFFGESWCWYFGIALEAASQEDLILRLSPSDASVYRAETECWPDEA